MSPVDRADPLTGTNFTLGSNEKFQPSFQDDGKRSKMSCGAKFEKQSQHGKTQSYNFSHLSYMYNGGQKNLGLCEKAFPSNSSVGFCS